MGNLKGSSPFDCTIQHRISGAFCLQTDARQFSIARPRIIGHSQGDRALSGIGLEAIIGLRQRDNGLFRRESAVGSVRRAVRARYRFGLHVGLFGCFLTFHHFRPVEKAVQIVDKEDNEANYDRHVRRSRVGRQRPKNYQHQIVRGISQGKKGAASESKVHGKETCGNGYRADKQVCRAKRAENEIKRHGDNRRQRERKQYFFYPEPVDLDLGAVALERIPYPGNQSADSHRRAHSKISYHLAVIGGRPRNYAVQDGKKQP